MTRTVRFRQFAASAQSTLKERVAPLLQGVAGPESPSPALSFREAPTEASPAAALRVALALASQPQTDDCVAALVPVGEAGFALVLAPPAQGRASVGALCDAVDAVSASFGHWRRAAGIVVARPEASHAAARAVLLHLGPARSVLIEAADGSAIHLLHEAQAGQVAAALRAHADGIDGLLRAAWGLVLARTCGRDHVVFAARVGTGAGQIMAHRLDLAGCKTLQDLMSATSDATATGDDVSGALCNWPEATVRQPVFETLLDLCPARDPAGDALTPFQLRAEVGGDDFLSLQAVQQPEDAGGQIASFLQGAALTSHLARLLGAIAVAAPEAPLSALDMLDPTERAGLRRLAAPDLPLAEAPACPITRFEAMAAARPEAPALISDIDALTLCYGELDRRANALAHRLAAVGLGPERVCAINLPRGADFIIASLAVLKCGAAFLPLDPVLPEAERSLRAAEAGAQAVIGHEGLAGLAAPIHPQDGTLRDAPPSRPAPDADRLAYVIHTSGSTGRPKGVMGTTGALSAHASAVIAAYGLVADDRVLQFASPGFDVALEEIIPTLLAGAALVVRGEEEARSIQAFLTLVQRRGLSVLNLPASFWHVLVEEMSSRALRLPLSVRLVVTGSERILPAALAQWQRLAPDCHWINGYGPTETTITATFHAPDLAHEPIDASADIPIGRPLPHATAHVLAFDGSLAPPGSEGGLHIGGKAVTRGYLQQPATTAEVFVPDPFAAPGGRLYNTGDRARWRPDGTLDFLGRRDRQVKLRGQRIDLGEIERVLGQVEGLREARVAVDAAGTDAARLIAWVSGPDLTEGGAVPSGLVDAVARHLSGAALPVLVPVAAFPIKPNGKVDMTALPLPDLRGAAPEAGPADERTESVIACLAEVLGRDSINPDVDIRDLGANSLVALRLASVLEARFGRPVIATDLYRNPTARKIASFLGSEPELSGSVVPIQTGGTKPPFLAVHVLGDKEMLFRPLAAALGPDYPVYGLTVGPPARLSDVTVEGIARRYFDDVQKAFPEGPLALGGVSMAAYFAYELGQQLVAAGRDVRVLAAIDADGPAGRPSVRGIPRLRAHWRQFARHGFGHLAAIIRSRMGARREARELAATPPDEVTGLNLVMANVHAVESYHPAPYLRPIAVYRAGDSFWDSDEALRSKLGWEPVARGGLSMVDVPGDHLTILQAQNVVHMAQHLAMMICGGI